MRAFSRWWDPSATSKAEWESLLERGPSLAITIEIPDIVRDLVVQHRAEIPAPHSGTALIDTGATRTAVDQEVFRQFGLHPQYREPAHTPSGRSWFWVYVCKLTFPDTPIPEIPLIPVIGCDMTGFGHSALLGRDFLKDCLLVYNGPEGYWTLA